MRKLLLLASVLVAMSVAVPGLAQDAPVDLYAPGEPPVEGPGSDAPPGGPPAESPVPPPVTVDEATPVAGPPVEGPGAGPPPGEPPVEDPGTDAPPSGPPSEVPEGPPVFVEEDTPVGEPPSEDAEAPLGIPQALLEEFGRLDDAGGDDFEPEAGDNKADIGDRKLGFGERRGGIFQRLLGNDDDDFFDNEIDQEAESGDVEQEIDISLSGDNSNQCVAIVQNGSSGNNQNAQGVTQDNAVAEDLELGGGGIAITPELVQECRQAVQQTAVAGERPKRQPRVAPGVVGTAPRAAKAPAIGAPTIARPLTGQPLAGRTAAAPGALPRTGGILGSDGALLGLGVGALLIGGGLLARRIFL